MTVHTPECPRLLLVEQDGQDATRLEAEVQKSGACFDVERAARLEEACNLLREHSFDAILLDLNLPDSSGLATFATINAAAASIPIVILSSGIDDAHALRALHAGAEDCLVKAQTYGTLLVRTIRYAIERRRSEEALRLQARLLDEISEAVIGVDSDNRVTSWNRYAEIMFGMSCEEAEGKALNDLIRVTGMPGPALRISDLGAHEGPGRWSREVDLCVRDNQVIHALMKYKPLKDMGMGTGAVIVIVDITNQVRADEAVRFQAHLLDTVEQSVIATDLKGRITYWNRHSTELYGYRAEEVIGKPITMICAEDRGHDVLEKIARVRSFSAEMTMKRKAGSEFPALVTITPILDENGEPIGIVGISVDLTERRRLEEQLRQSQKLEAVGTLAGGIAHDFNNLLTSITGYADLLIGSLDEGDARRDDALEVRHAALRAASLTRQLLAFSRKQVLQPRVLDLTDVISEMEKMLRRLIREDIHLITRFEAGGQLIKADQGQIEQVIMNLVVNARDAMPQGGDIVIESRTVEIRNGVYGKMHFGVPDGRYALLEVSDRGTGMDAATLQRIFEPFFTTKPMGQGTGLGLATVYGIVKQSDGAIAVESTPGMGTTFVIVLPITPDRRQAQQRTAPRPRERGAGTILVVEDDRWLRNLVTRVLRNSGYTIIEAENGAQATRLIKSRPDIDLLVTDVIMPGISGPALVEQLRAAGSKVPVLYISGYTSEEMKFEQPLPPGTSLLEKPFSPGDLIAKVRDVFQRRAA